MCIRRVRSTGGAAAKILASHNVCIGLTAVPEGNHLAVELGLKESGRSPGLSSHPPARRHRLVEIPRADD